jgi:hypothetical protein
LEWLPLARGFVQLARIALELARRLDVEAGVRKRLPKLHLAVAVQVWLHFLGLEPGSVPKAAVSIR